MSRSRIRLLAILLTLALLAHGAPWPGIAAVPPSNDSRPEPVPQRPAVWPFCVNWPEIPTAECDALVALYDSTNGPGWAQSMGWTNPLVSPCSWFGVSCNGGHVSLLYLEGNHLSGPIPPQVGDLTNLRLLDLLGNQVSGAIPPQLGNLSSLEILDLSGNHLSGAIPPQLSNLSNLGYLDLRINQLSGAIPPQLGNLSHLTQLHLQGNQLSGAIPSTLGNLSSLLVLEILGNQLNDAIPPTLGNLSSLTTLDLSRNQLSGAIPSTLGNLSRLRELQLQGNQLSGAIPPQLCNQPYRILDLAWNALTSGPACIAVDDPDWAQTQTVPPTNLWAVLFLPAAVQLSWTPILYTADGGYYEVFYATTAGGALTQHGRTADKSASGYMARNLAPGTYYFRVRTYTPAHGLQQNALTSIFSAESAPVVIPAVNTFTPTPTATSTATPTPTPTATPTPTEPPGATGRIRGTVWYDLDGDGVLEGAEPRLGGVTVRLYLGGAQVGLAVTQAGVYDFTGLEAERIYLVGEAQPPWLRFSSTPDEQFVALRRGETAVVDFGDWSGRATWLPFVLRR